MHAAENRDRSDVRKPNMREPPTTYLDMLDSSLPKQGRDMYDI